MRLAVRSRLEVQARGEQAVEQIDAEARRMPDQVERLRHLRAFLILSPRRFRWRSFLWKRPPLLELTALVMAAALIGVAILVWILK